MAKRIREAVQVAVEHDGPAAFRWRRRRYQVRAILGHWREDASSWVGGSVEVPQRDLWRVEAVRGGTRGIFELVREADRWSLDRLWD